MNDFSLIVAFDLRGAIGRYDTNDLPWHLKGDLEHFKRTTWKRPVIMGGRTWRSLPVRPLPSRRNVVVTRAGGILLADTTYASLEDALLNESNPVVIGGGEIYRSAMELGPKTMHITIVHTISDGDVYFPLTGRMLDGQLSVRTQFARYERRHYEPRAEGDLRYDITRWERVR